MPRHSAPQQPSWLRPRLVVAFVVAAAGLVTAVWLPTRNDSADAAERNRSSDSRRDRVPALPAFADDFSGGRGSTVDPDRWGLRTDRVGELQFTENVRSARLDGEGNLVIVLRGENNDAFSTARLFSKSALRGATGRVEARIKAPGGEGLQPTFELVDAVEPRSGALNVLAEPVTDGDFHTYAVDWKPGEVVVSVDGRPVRQEIPEGLDTDRPFRVALTLGVDGDRVRTDLPARMVVDSVSFTATPPTETSPPATTPPATTPPAATTPPTTAPTTEPPATTPPTTTPPAATTPPTTPPTSAPAAAAWAPFTDYIAGQLVTFSGVEYQVLESHTSLPGWEPTALPALFKKI